MDKIHYKVYAGSLPRSGATTITHDLDESKIVGINAIFEDQKGRQIAVANTIRAAFSRVHQEVSFKDGEIFVNAPPSQGRSFRLLVAVAAD